MFVIQGEMDAREDVIRACATSGQALVDSGHRASSEVSAALEALERESGALQQLWEQRRVLYLQCMDLQLFYRDTEQADAWMHKQEVSSKRVMIAWYFFENLSSATRGFASMTRVLVILWLFHFID